MVLNSYSKINLTLTINSKKKGGLHEIQSYYCLINLNDKIKIKKINKKKDKIYFKGPFARHIKRSDNSIIYLLKFLRKQKLISNFYSIIVNKKIPVFGGLGGGTSNAVFILKSLLKKKINKNIFNKLEKLIGSDFKLFFHRQGFLDNNKSVKILKKKHKLIFVLLRPNIRCSTQEIYSRVKSYTKKDKFNSHKTNTKKKFINYILNNKNDLQSIVEKKHPVIKQLLTDISVEKGCYLSRMSGSGSVCYGLFSNESAAKKALNKMKSRYPKFWFSLAKTV
jgi:4-diphosphocytidyl-2-C-methyl-D-erythritol kinase